MRSTTMSAIAVCVACVNQRSKIWRHLAFGISVGILLLLQCSCSPIKPTETPLDRRQAPAAEAVYNLNPNTASQRLWVFIDGDGRPWRWGRFVAKAPELPNAQAFALWQSTPEPAIYLQRPCYSGIHPHNAASALHCHPYWWTSGRYAPAVTLSLKNALLTELSKHRLAPQTQIILVGFSGGAPLAIDLYRALAAEMPSRMSVCAIVTLAGALLTEKPEQQFSAVAPWHPKSGVSAPPPTAPVSVPLWHFAGTEDRVINAAVWPRVLARYGGSLYWLPSDHDGWQPHWQSIRQQLITAIPACAAGAKQKSPFTKLSDGQETP